jgi:tRNA (cytidine/uridine-2'-O-)-methyltransferase
MGFNIVLVEPEIPQNTGNIARTCAATGSTLHLIHPLGFEITDKHLKRSGLDYWSDVKIEHHNSFEDLRMKYSDGRFWFSTTKAPKKYTEVDFIDNDFIVFGKETKGLPEDLLRMNIDQTIRVPMGTLIRSLNLSNTVAIVLYEALRQNDFFELEGESNYLQLFS